MTKNILILDSDPYDIVMDKMVMGKIEEYRKRLNDLIKDIKDDSLLGYSEAILNLLGEFSNGQCADCPFSYESEYHCPDFISPEYDLKCKLENCWIDTVKELIRNDGVNDGIMPGILTDKEKAENDQDLKIYVAGSLKNQFTVRCVMKDIESMGCQIAVDWVKDIDVTECIKGLEQCDGLIFCMDGFKSRGKNFEIGYAYALKKPIIVYPIYPFKESIENLLENESTFLKLFPIIKSRDDIKDWITNLKEKKK